MMENEGEASKARIQTTEKERPLCGGATSLQNKEAASIGGLALNFRLGHGENSSRYSSQRLCRATNAG
jgi:hypothetical protein